CEREQKDLFDPADPAQVDGGDRADGLHRLAADVLDARAVAAGRGRYAASQAGGVAVGADEDEVGAGGVGDLLQVGEVGDHERVARRGGELLDDADDVEGRDAEAAGRVVEHAQP